MPAHDTFSFASLIEGEQRDHEYAITPEVYESFLRAFDDRSPLHVDADYARGQGFMGPVMHGAILNGFVSHFIGMVFPGSSSLLLSVDMRYLQPSYLGDRLRIRGKVAQQLEVQQVVVINLRILNEARAVTVASGRAQVKVSVP